VAENKLEVSFTDDVSPFLSGVENRIRRAVESVVQETADKAGQRIHNRTPRDRGTAAAAWRRTSSVGGQEATFSNSTPYINVLEFGGYPIIPASRTPTRSGLQRRGGAFIGGGAYPPGSRRTSAAPSGEPSMTSNVSQALGRQGMVRVTLTEIEPEFVFDMEEAIDAALSGVTLA